MTQMRTDNTWQNWRLKENTQKPIIKKLKVWTRLDHTLRDLLSVESINRPTRTLTVSGFGLTNLIASWLPTAKPAPPHVMLSFSIFLISKKANMEKWMTRHPINFVQNSLTHINPATSAHYFQQITTKEHINTESFI